MTTRSVLAKHAQTQLGIDWQHVEQIEACSVRNADETVGSVVVSSPKGIRTYRGGKMPLTFRIHSKEQYYRVSNLCEVISFLKI